MPNLTEEQLQGKLLKNDFFNPNWSDSRVIDSVNYAYNEVIRKNDNPHGEYTVTYFSEPVTVAFDHGQFKSGWGDYKYTLEEFLEQYGGM